MTNNFSNNKEEPSFFKIFIDGIKSFFDDLSSGNLKRTLSRDFKELKEFFLPEDRRCQLREMGKFKRAFYTTGWLLKSLLLKLTPMRRALLVIGLLLMLISRNSNGNSNNKVIIGGMLLLFVLMLELKDKMFARNELEAGRAVQNALMPEMKPTVPGWSLWLFTRPANEVGGDLVDYLQLNANRFGVAIGDVAGKGLGAALLMAKLQSTLRALLPDYDLLTELGTKLNNIFCRDSITKSFASLLYLELQSDSGIIRFLNAGHMPPIAMKGANIYEMPKGEPALGIIPEQAYTEQQIELQPKELFLVYSDGLTEARNEQGEFFGEKRLMDLLPKLSRLSSEEAGNRILAEIDHFTGEARPNDDLSMVILRRLE